MPDHALSHALRSVWIALQEFENHAQQYSNAALHGVGDGLGDRGHDIFWVAFGHGVDDVGHRLPR